MRLRFIGLVAAIVVAAGILLPTTASANRIPHIEGTHPVIFVHGGSGSGAQFESQAMRFESNFYPHEYIKVLEYDSQSLYNFSTGQVNEPLLQQVWSNLDQLIAATEAETGADKVDILGHSLGTMVMQGYINSSAERAAKLAHYVNIDGQTADALPGTSVGVPVPTLALWAGRGTPSPNGLNTGPREIVGATNVIIPDQTHVQCATSPQSFVEIYKFFTGFAPRTSYILPEPGSIELAGRAVLFPQNVGVAGASVEIWKVNRNTGYRIASRPEAVYAIGEDGNWGPFLGVSGQAYEFNIVRAGQSPHPFYYEPFLRSDYLIRLNTSPEPGGGISGTMDRSPNHVNLVVTRSMEFWGDQGAEDDVLTVNGINLISPTTDPLSKLINAMFLFDKGSDGVSHLGVPLQPYASITFFTGIDLYAPGAVRPNGTVSLVLTSRVGGGLTQTINVPNIASSEVRRISVNFSDFVQPVGVPFRAPHEPQIAEPID
jgi:hypothetical protein